MSDVGAGGFGGVAAGERGLGGGGQGEEAVEEAFDPSGLRGDGAGDGEREESRQRAGAHGGEVGEAAGEGTVADGGGRVPVAAEVTAFERQIGGDDDLVAAGRGKDGAVVADAEAEGAGAAGGNGGALANALNPGELSKRDHGPLARGQGL